MQSTASMMRWRAESVPVKRKSNYLYFLIWVNLSYTFLAKHVVKRDRSNGLVHAALQTFFCGPLALSIQFPTHNFFKKIWLFKPKYDIFEQHFRKLWSFSQIYREIFKIILNPYTLYISVSCFEWTCGPRKKITENGPWLEKSGHPWSSG